MLLTSSVARISLAAADWPMIHVHACSRHARNASSSPRKTEERCGAFGKVTCVQQCGCSCVCSRRMASPKDLMIRKWRLQTWKLSSIGLPPRGFGILIFKCESLFHIFKVEIGFTDLLYLQMEQSYVVNYHWIVLIYQSKTAKGFIITVLCIR
jgi:hypothetical protein